MKVILYLSLLLTLDSFGQSERRFPFQVLDARSAFDKKGRPINRLDFLTRKQKVTLKDGVLHLVHHTGLAITIAGDSVLELHELHSKLIDFSVAQLEKRPNLTQLFSASPMVRSMIHDFHPWFVVPPPNFSSTTAHNIEQDLCLKWKESDSNEYQIVIENMFADELKSYHCDSNSIRITSKELNAIAKDENALLVTVKASKQWYETILFILRRNSVVSGIAQCDLRTADQALMIGYYLEKSAIVNEHEMLKEAEVFYRMATEISDEPVFREALDLFLKRKNLD